MTSAPSCCELPVRSPPPPPIPPPLQLAPLSWRDRFEDDDEVVEIFRSLPRPLMPRFEFLYRPAKYSNMSRSAGLHSSLSRMAANFSVNARSVAAWNLFWWDCGVPSFPSATVALLLLLVLNPGTGKKECGLRVAPDLQISQLRELLAAVL